MQYTHVLAGERRAHIEFNITYNQPYTPGCFLRVDNAAWLQHQRSSGAGVLWYQTLRRAATRSCLAQVSWTETAVPPKATSPSALLSPPWKQVPPCECDSDAVRYRRDWRNQWLCFVCVICFYYHSVKKQGAAAWKRIYSLFKDGISKGVVNPGSAWI